MRLQKKSAAAVVRAISCFQTIESGNQLSENSLTSLLKRMKYDHVTTHGFRSAFRDWAGQESHFPNDIIEMALAHLFGRDESRAGVST